jgi:hypothetical protein
MSNALAVYLQDHLAGSVHGVELARHIRDEHAGESLGAFAAELTTEIEADQKVLQSLADRIAGGSSSVKEVSAWVSEKMARLKLTHHSKESIGTFESLELIRLGITGKLALWQALKTIADMEPRLHGVDLDGLSARAESQIAAVEERRLESARRALVQLVDK